MAESSRGIPSTFDILLGANYDSDEDNKVTRDNFELSTAELQEHNVYPIGLTAWMKKQKKKHTIFIRYQSTNDIEGTRFLSRLQQWYIEVALSRYGSKGTTNTDLRKYLRRDLLGHNPPDTDDRRCWDVYDSTQVLTLPAVAPAPTERRSTRTCCSSTCPGTNANCGTSSNGGVLF